MVSRPGEVSIHALLAECDQFNIIFYKLQEVSIHALLAECDSIKRPVLNLCLTFQSTHSLRSATPTASWLGYIRQVSIHALLAECDLVLMFFPKDKRVSIHALLAECDRHWLIPGLRIPGFNPRTPCGVRLLFCPHPLLLFPVSIHALLAECDVPYQRA